MYDVVIIPGDNGDGIFKELDILAMSSLFVEALKPLINDTVAMHLIEFFREFDDSGVREENNEMAKSLVTKVDWLHENIKSRLNEVTLHLKFREDPIISRLGKYKYEDIKNLSKDERKELKEKIEYVLKTRKDIGWDNKIVARKQEDFKAFIVACEQVSKAAEQLQIKLIALDPDHTYDRTYNMARWVNRDKSPFYRKNEKDKITGLEFYSRLRPVLEELLEGISYQDFVQEKNLFTRYSRKVLIL